MIQTPIFFNAILDVKGINNKIDNIVLTQYDTNAYSLNVSVISGTDILDLTNCTARVYFTKPDGTVSFQDMVIDDAPNGKMSVELDSQIAAAQGRVKAELKIYNTSNMKLTIGIFFITVRNSSQDDAAIESTNEYSALVTALSTVTTIANKADKTYVDSQDTILSGKIGNLSGAGLVEVDLATAIKNDRASLADIAYNVECISGTDDNKLSSAMLSVLFNTIILSPGKTYTLTSNLTITKNIIGNGATIITPNIYLNSNLKITNVTFNVTGIINGTGQTNIKMEDVIINSSQTTSNGLYFTLCTNIRLRNVLVNNGFRGITLEKCDDFILDDCKTVNVNTSGAYGILVFNSTSTVHGNGIISKCVAIDCFFGICFNGGEADKTKGGFQANYVIDKLEITHCKVLNSDTDNLVGCIWGTCSQNVNINNCETYGGYDVGIDFEHCYNCIADNNIINNHYAGALSSLFGSNEIVFSNNKILFDKDRTNTGGLWKTNTSNAVVLIRDKSTNITVENNEFKVVGHLGIVEIWKIDTDYITDTLIIKNNKFRNCYIASQPYNNNMSIEDNKFYFDININNAIIDLACVTNLSILKNKFYLLPNDSITDITKGYISIYDATGNTFYSDYIDIIDNDINLTNGRIVVITPNNFKGRIQRNKVDSIRFTFNGSRDFYTNLLYSDNNMYSDTGVTTPCAYDNTTVIFNLLPSKPNYKKSIVANPSATANVSGTSYNLLPTKFYTSLVPFACDVVFGGTFGSETVSATMTVIYSDTTTYNKTKTATSASTVSFTSSDIMSLIKDGVYINKITFYSLSNINNTAVTVTFNHFGMYSI